MCLTKDKDVKGRATIQSLVVVKDDSLFRVCKQQKVSGMQPLVCAFVFIQARLEGSFVAGQRNVQVF